MSASFAPPPIPESHQITMSSAPSLLSWPEVAAGRSPPNAHPQVGFSLPPCPKSPTVDLGESWSHSGSPSSAASPRRNDHHARRAGTGAWKISNGAPRLHSPHRSHKDPAHISTHPVENPTRHRESTHPAPQKKPTMLVKAAEKAAERIARFAKPVDQTPEGQARRGTSSSSGGDSWGAATAS